MQAFIVLCDAAQIDQSTGKVSILGGDWSMTGPDLMSMAIVVFVRTSWEEASAPRPFRLRLLSADGKPVEASQKGEVKPIQFQGTLALNLSAAEADKSARLVDIHTSFTIAAPFIGQALKPGAVYTWSLEVEERELSTVRFAVRPSVDADEPE